MTVSDPYLDHFRVADWGVSRVYQASNKIGLKSRTLLRPLQITTEVVLKTSILDVGATGNQ
jgi:hypothetical protein